MKIQKIVGATISALAIGALAACGGGQATPSGATSGTDATASGEASASGETDASGDVTTLTIGASASPHAVILEYVDSELAPAAGLDLNVVVYDDYVLPNVALSEGDLDANYFQHKPYLDAQIEEKGYDFTSIAAVHIEPLGIYSDKVTSVDEVADGGKVGITNDPSNQSRALELLAAQGLVTLKDNDGDGAYTIYEIDQNSKNLQFTETAPEQLVRSLADVDLAVINGNFALEGGLTPSKDALVLESGVDNPYANLLVVRTEDAQDPALSALADLLTSPEVKAFIEEQWPDGEVIPAF